MIANLWYYVEGNRIQSELFAGLKFDN